MGFKIETIFLIAEPKGKRTNKVTKHNIYRSLLLLSLKHVIHKDESQIILKNNKINTSITYVLKDYYMDPLVVVSSRNFK